MTLKPFAIYNLHFVVFCKIITIFLQGKCSLFLQLLCKWPCGKHVNQMLIASCRMHFLLSTPTQISGWQKWEKSYFSLSTSFLDYFRTVLSVYRDFFCFEFWTTHRLDFYLLWCALYDFFGRLFSHSKNFFPRVSWSLTRILPSAWYPDQTIFHG